MAPITQPAADVGLLGFPRDALDPFSSASRSAPSGRTGPSAPRASSIRCFDASQRGVSGSQNIDTSNMTAGTAATAIIQRHDIAP
jgi:hypothetical protein